MVIERVRKGGGARGWTQGGKGRVGVEAANVGVGEMRDER